MSDYAQINDYSAKDALASGNPEKLILGSDIDDELAAISTAIATKYDSSDLASQAQAEAETSNVVLMTPLRVANWADFNAGVVGDLQAFADPNADRILFWDDSAGAAAGLAVDGTNIVITATTVNLGTALSLTAATFSGTVTANLFSGSGASLTSIPAGQLTGSIADARLSANVPLINASNTFTGATQSVSATTPALVLDGTGAGTTASLSFRRSTTAKAYVGTELQAGQLITGSAQDDLGIRTQGGKINFSVDSGSSSVLTIDSSGQVTTKNSNPSEVGFKGTPPNDINGNLTLALTDCGKSVMYTGTGGHTVTIPANASVAFPRGTVIRILNAGSGTLSIAITSDTMYLTGTAYGTTGTRTLATGGVAVIEKYNSVGWFISGVGLS